MIPCSRDRDYYSNVHRRFHPALSYSEDHTLCAGWWAVVWDEAILIVPLNSCCCECVCEVQRPLQDILLWRSQSFTEWSFLVVNEAPESCLGQSESVLLRAEQGWWERRICVYFECCSVAPICLCGFWRVRSPVLSSLLLKDKRVFFVKDGWYACYK